MNLKTCSGSGNTTSSNTLAFLWPSLGFNCYKTPIFLNFCESVTDLPTDGRADNDSKLFPFFESGTNICLKVIIPKGPLTQAEPNSKWPFSYVTSPCSPIPYLLHLEFLPSFLFRCVLASLYESLSVRPSVRPSVGWSRFRRKRENR